MSCDPFGRAMCLLRFYQVEVPLFTPDGGVIVDGALITITSPAKFNTICYTTDGLSDPRCSASEEPRCTAGLQYDTPIAKRCDMNGQIWKAVACEALGYASGCAPVPRLYTEVTPPPSPGPWFASS